MALGADGTAVVIWRSWNGAGTRVMAAVRPPASRRFGVPRPISARGQVTDVTVAADRFGNVLVAWVAALERVETAMLPAGSTAFRTRQRLPLEPEGVLDGPEVAFDGRGNAFVTWVGGRVRVAERPRGGDRSFGPAHTLAHEGSTVSIAADRDGAVLVTWRKQGAEKSVLRPAGRPRFVPAGAPFNADMLDRGSLQFAETGEAIAAGAADSGVNVTIRAAGNQGTFDDGAGLTVDECAEAAFEQSRASLATGAAGAAVIAWHDTCATYPRVWVAIRSAGKAFSTACALLPDGERASDPQVAMDRAGRVTLVWRGEDPSGRPMIRSTNRPADVC